MDLMFFTSRAAARSCRSLVFPEEEDVCQYKKGNFCFRVHASLIICLVMNFLEICKKINVLKNFEKITSMIFYF